MSSISDKFRNIVLFPAPHSLKLNSSDGTIWEQGEFSFTLPLRLNCSVHEVVM